VRIAACTPFLTIDAVFEFSTVSWHKGIVVGKEVQQMDITIRISEYLGYGVTVAVFGAVVIVAYLRNRK